MSNPSLGTIACPTCREATAEVRQTKRRGAHLYWQCPECGLNQPTGAGIQARLWRDTDWAPGAQPIRPANVAADLERGQPPEFDPAEAEAEAEPEPAAEPTTRPSPARGVGILLLGALTLGVALATN